MMLDQRRRWTWLVLVAMTLATAGLGLALAEPTQEPKPKADGSPKGQVQPSDPARASKSPTKAKAKRGGLRLDPRNPPKGKMGQPDPLDPGAQLPAPAPKGQDQPKQADQAKGQAANAAGQPQGVPKWPFHYELKIFHENQPLTAKYYPPEKPFQAPVLLLLHESGRGRSSRDFEEPIEGLNKRGFAAHMQEQGYAVLLLDLRGHGGNPRHEVNQQHWRASVTDLQAVYRFLIDRHNRGELDLGKFGVVALGDAGNLAATWASTPDAAVSSEGRESDLGALVLVSPLADARGLALSRILPQIAPRFPMLLISGDRDEQSIQPVRDSQPVVERHRLSQVAYFDSALHGEKLLNFFPKVPEAIEKFLNDPVKFRAGEWEPRYLLDPVRFDEISLIADSGYLPIPGAPGDALPKAKADAGAPQPKAPAANKKGAERK